MTDFTRTKSTITPNPDTGEGHKDYESINKAKKKSRELQSAGKTVRKG